MTKETVFVFNHEDIKKIIADRAAFTPVEKIEITSVIPTYYGFGDWKLAITFKEVNAPQTK